ncbi:MAG: TlpA disulfide reductase family protein [Edaphobacter sp.]
MKATLSKSVRTIALVAVCNSFGTMSPHTGLAQAAVNDSSPDLKVAALVGKSAPDFVIRTLDSREISLADYKGKAVLVSFWATWCAACKLEMPWLAQLREEYGGQGFEIIGIVTDRATDEKVRQIADKYGVKYPVLRCNHKTAEAYGGLPYLPESFYIDKHGRVVLADAAADSKDGIETNIRRLLGLGVR